MTKTLHPSSNIISTKFLDFYFIFIRFYAVFILLWIYDERILQQPEENLLLKLY